MGGTFCHPLFGDFKLSNLTEKNTYNLPLSNQQINRQVFQTTFKKIFGNNNHLKDRYTNLINFLCQNTDKLFQDPNFQLNGTHASKLYSYKNKKMYFYDRNDKLGNDVFQQINVQFTYLSIIGYFLCQNKQFLANRILLTQQFNNNHIYALRFFCNGKDQEVIVDDIIPTHSMDVISYTQSKGKEIWPIILQKAWSKLIGGYEKARGLSPMECLQEIIGIPTYAYPIYDNQGLSFLEELNKLKQQGLWLCAIGRRQVKVIQDGQVFIINKIEGQTIQIMSPYTNVELLKNNQMGKGITKLKFDAFVWLFSHLIVGYYKRSFELLTFRVESQKRQEKLYQIHINKSQQISIRFVQFYRDYLMKNQQDQQNKQSGYQYSPMALFQIYDKNGNLMSSCQGCERLHVGAHSIYLTNNIFHFLEKGTYYLRIQVDWNYEAILKEGNLVFYLQDKDSVKIKQLSHFDQIEKTKILHLNSLNLPSAVIIQSQHQPLNLKYLKKRYNILLSIENTSKEKLILELDFKGSYNFRIKDQEIKDKKIILKLGANQLKILQIMPDQLRPQSNIQMCTIKRLPNPQK